MSTPGWIGKALAGDGARRVEKAAGVPMRDILGCGYYGCVFESDSPWVVKMTRDSTEGPMWSIIGEYLEDSPYGADGVAQVLRVRQLEPGIRWHRKDWPLYVIVREAVEPLLGSDGYDFSAYTQVLISRGAVSVADVKACRSSMLQFMWAARDWHHARNLKREHNARRGMEVAMSRMYEELDRGFRGYVGEYLGAFLREMMDYDLVLRDVHPGNVGWRTRNKVLGRELHTGLVVLDPGHTPSYDYDVPAIETARRNRQRLLSQ